MTAIKVGQNVDIVLETGVIKLSFVQDIIDDRIVLLQIVPPLTSGHISKTILITYATKENRHVRMGFHAIIVEIREGYVTVGRGFPVIIVIPISSSEVCDLRSHTRQLPQQEMTIKLGADNLELIDISEGGAHLVRKLVTKSTLKVDDIIVLVIQSDQEKDTRQARIIRQWHAKDTTDPEHLAVIFITKKLT